MQDATFQSSVGINHNTRNQVIDDSVDLLSDHMEGSVLDVIEHYNA